MHGCLDRKGSYGIFYLKMRLNHKKSYGNDTFFLVMEMMLRRWRLYYWPYYRSRAMHNMNQLNRPSVHQTMKFSEKTTTILYVITVRGTKIANDCYGNDIDQYYFILTLNGCPSMMYSLSTYTCDAVACTIIRPILWKKHTESITPYCLCHWLLPSDIGDKYW